MDDRLLRPSWADARLSPCGFTPRGVRGPSAVEAKLQVHGSRVVLVRSPAEAPAEADGLWTDVPGLAVAVRVADCTPILLWDPGAPAVAAVHAGWRGTAADIAGEAVAVGRRELGARPERLFAAIGPCISGAAYEVGDEVVQGLRAAGLADRDFALRLGPRGRPHVDLRAANRALLLRAGLKDARIEDVGGCSFSEPERYESFRRDGAASLRMRALISLAPLLLALFALGCDEERALEDAEVARLADAAAEALEADRPQRAEELLRALLVERPDDAHVRGQLARALSAQQRFAEAVVQGQLALGIDPMLWQTAYNLACAEARLGHVDAALHWLQVAAASGRLQPSEVAADEDLAALHPDHRFAFYLSTGVVTRAEEDAVARITPASVAVGERATLTLAYVALNRPLLAPREETALRLAAPLPEGGLLPEVRRETFSTGEAAGREYLQRTVHFGFRALRPGVLALGPFEVTVGDRVLWTNVPLLEVRAGGAGGVEGDLALQTALHDFFRAPSEADREVLAGAAAGAPEDAVFWDDGGLRRAVRFRAATETEGVPDDFGEREEGWVRSVLIQRGSEGWSHAIDRRLPEDAQAE